MLAETVFRFLAALSVAASVGAIWGLIVAKFIHTNPLDFWPCIIGYSGWAGLIGVLVGAVWACAYWSRFR
jgi:hypothetical protein